MLVRRDAIDRLAAAREYDATRDVGGTLSGARIANGLADATSVKWFRSPAPCGTVRRGRVRLLPHTRTIDELIRFCFRRHRRSAQGARLREDQ